MTRLQWIFYGAATAFTLASGVLTDTGADALSTACFILALSNTGCLALATLSEVG